MWKQIQSHLRSPLIRQFELREDRFGIQLLSGISAVSHYTLLGDNEYRTYAVGKKDIGGLAIEKKDMVVSGERPACIIQELGYLIPSEDGSTVDPLSASLLLTGEEKQDERVLKAVDEMLEECVWYRE